MDEYPIIAKLCSWPTVIGFLAGGAAVAFVVYPPHVGWGDGMKWGDVATWVGAVMSGGAAIAAWYAARSALKLAHLPVAQQESFRIAKARAISAAIVTELAAAQEVMRWGKSTLSGQTAETDEKRASGAIKALRIDKVAMIERFLPELSVFGETNSIVMVSAAGEILNFNSAMERIEHRLESKLMAALFGNEHIPSTINEAIRDCSRGYEIVSIALEVVTSHMRIEG